MTTIRIQGKNQIIDHEEEVVNYLNDQGVIYEHWNMDKLDESLRDRFALTDEDKEAILSTFKEEIEDISARRGYQARDVISLSESTPNLEELLKNFQQEHHHTDDEVRFIVSGHGVFVIQGKDGDFFEVHLNPGDLISVPENIRHYFTLSDDKQVVAVRIFVTQEGWVPIY
ncbi:1,2-dihydroxy-3-keto-5-methylthiopentene dioxygenase [Rossellomorea vietnamensis]|uniref:1,2-dihydroxy-3-keto-5-methylthiopentene dioxygenase n=1 Tax=Rossellomorea vietnamensis TaxID=218284 RepID=UPI001E3EDDDD|nr:cupin domain-containing protein [Rossellomorea vietnamensis]MCC5802544.1 cupin domain-containing protein [Rossellomorea vietnamensis]